MKWKKREKRRRKVTCEITLHSEIINRKTSKIVRFCDCFATDAIIRNLEEDNKKLQLKMAAVKQRALFQRSNPNPNALTLTLT